MLYGDVDPSGRLPYTIAYTATHYDFAPITTNIAMMGKDDWQSYFNEKLEIDYRYFDAHNVSVRYEFGYGLSYMTFELSDLQISEASPSTIITAFAAEQPTTPGGSPDLWIPLYKAEVTVCHTGSATGSTVAQLYLTFPKRAPAGTPIQQLRGFDKIALDAELLRQDISYWDTEVQHWRIPEGVFKVSVGFSSRDLVGAIAGKRSNGLTECGGLARKGIGDGLGIRAYLLKIALMLISFLAHC